MKRKGNVFCLLPYCVDWEMSGKNLLRFVFWDFECVGFFHPNAFECSEQSENVSDKTTYYECPKTHLIQPYLGATSRTWKCSCCSVSCAADRGEHSRVLGRSHCSEVPDSGIAAPLCLSPPDPCASRAERPCVKRSRSSSSLHGTTLPPFL